MIELKKCPFCGGNNFCIEFTKFMSYVFCTNCNAAGPDGKTRAEAVEAWNRRAKHEA